MMKRFICLALYYGFAQYLPDSYAPVFGKISNRIRVALCKGIFKKCGRITTVNRCAKFGKGTDVEIDDYSGIGAYCILPSDIKIGKYVMMGPNLYCLIYSHKTSEINIPMCFQGMESPPLGASIVIEDDVWIGANVIITKNRRIKKGTIIGAGAVVSKDFPEYSIVGGNPAKIIRSRLLKNGDKN